MIRADMDDRAWSAVAPPLSPMFWIVIWKSSLRAFYMTIIIYQNGYWLRPGQPSHAWTRNERDGRTPAAGSGASGMASAAWRRRRGDLEIGQ
jgi:hypothetical protein